MKIGVLASGKLGFEVLKGLIKSYRIEFICTDSNSISIIKLAESNSIKNYKGNPRNGKAIKAVGDIYIDVLVSINYLFLIEEDLISLPSVIAINIHGSLLPKYRGRTPHVWSIINGETLAGITIHEISKGCDEGKIIEQLEIPIHSDMTGGELLVEYGINYLPLLLKTLNKIENKDYQLINQNNNFATFFGKRTPDNGLINWNWSKERIFNWVRAQSEPYPGAFTYFNEQKIIIDKVSFSNIGFTYDMPDGMILSLDPIVVKCCNGALELTDIREDEIINKRIKIKAVFNS